MSSVRAVTEGDRVVLEFRLDRTSVADLLARSRPVAKPLRLADLEDGRSVLERYVHARLEVTNDALPCPLSAPALAFDDDTGRVRLDTVARCGGPLGRLEIRSTLFADESTPHELMLMLSHGPVERGFMFYQGERIFGVELSTLVPPAPSSPPLEATVAPPAGRADPAGGAVPVQDVAPARGVVPTQGAAPFVTLGLLHILAGWDHVLFVLVLVLVATTARRLAVVVTAFTLGHCLALAVATLGLVTASPASVEPLIAASIVGMVFHDVVVRSAIGPTLAVFGCGLLHGLGFAEVLVDLALPRAALAWALLAFNVGVELGQLAIVGVAFVLLAPVRRRPVWYRRVQLGAGAAIAIWALLWVVERTLDIQLVPG